MGLNKSSFELGASLVQGYFDDVRKDEDRKIAEEDRQRRIKEYDIRMEDLTRRNEEAKQEAADKKALRAAANPEMNSGTIVDGGTKTFTQDPAEAARVKAIEDAANFDDKPVKAESGFGLKDGKIVTQKQANDPLFGAGLQAEWLKKNGRAAEAFDLETKIEAAKTARAAAEKRAFSDEAIKAAQQGGAKGFADWFNANSKNGMQMRVTPALNGKGSVLVWGRDGEIEATYPIESDGALYSAVSRIIDPVASAKAYDSQQAAIAASRAKVTDSYATEFAKQQARVAAGTAGVSGSSRASTTKVEKTPQEQVMSQVATFFDKQTSPEQAALRIPALRVAAQIVEMNPPQGGASLRPELVADAAMQVVSNPSLIQPELNTKTLRLQGVVDVGGVKVIVPNAMPEETVKKATPVLAEKLFDGLSKNDPQFVNAVKGDQAAIEAEYASAMRQLVKEKGNPRLAVEKDSIDLVKKMVDQKIAQHRQLFSSSQTLTDIMTKKPNQAAEPSEWKKFWDAQNWAKIN